MFSFLKKKADIELSKMEDDFKALNYGVKYTNVEKEEDIKIAEDHILKAVNCVEKLEKYLAFFKKHNYYDVIEITNQALESSYEAVEQAKDSLQQLKGTNVDHSSAKKILSLIIQFSELAVQSVSIIERSSSVDGKKLYEFSNVSEADIENAEKIINLVDENLIKIENYFNVLEKNIHKHDSEEILEYAGNVLSSAQKAHHTIDRLFSNFKTLVGFPDFEEEFIRIEKLSDIVEDLVAKIERLTSDRKTLLVNLEEMNDSEIYESELSDPTVEIRKYKTLLDEGIITQVEFEKKKSELLKI